MKFKDYYETLGVARDAHADELKRAYRRLARKYHPDVSQETDAEAHFKEVGEAYEVLKDPKKRAAYDNLGAGWSDGQDFTPPSQWSSFFRDGGRSGQVDFGEFSDFFQTLFDRDEAGLGNVRSADIPGADAKYEIEVSLEEACSGGERALRLQPLVAQATSAQGRTLNVKIPSGVTDGQHIRLAGQGNPGPGGRRGDLFLVVRLQAHSLFKLAGHDVYLSLPVTPWEAALGAIIQVPTPTGSVELKVPAGSDTGRKLRLRGRGMGRNPVGDQYVELAVHTPAARNAEDEALYRKLETQMDFDPRAKLMAAISS
jgi:curved DNA-binding protein